MISDTAKRFVNLQDVLGMMSKYGCLFLCIIGIAEEYNKAPVDLIGAYRDFRLRNWIDDEFTCNDSLAMLHYLTGVKWERKVVTTLPSVIADNEYTIETWVNDNKTHFRRRFVDTVKDSQTVRMGILTGYYIYIAGGK